MTFDLTFPKTYVVWDLETTGLNSSQDRIVEFAALMVKDGEVVESESFILNHGIDIPVEASRIHGITKEKCEAEGVDPNVALARAIEIFKEYPASVTHNGLRFDIPFIVEEIFRSNMITTSETELLSQRLYDTCIDTAVIYKAKKIDLARRWNEPFADWGRRVMDTIAPGVKFNVGICCDELSIDRSNIVQHRTGGDVMLTNEIYKKITAKEI